MVKVTITTATHLSKEKQAELMSAVMDKYTEEVSVQFNVDEAIIGGVIITDRDRVFDGSVLGKLNQVKRVIRK